MFSFLRNTINVWVVFNYHYNDDNDNNYSNNKNYLKKWINKAKFTKNKEGKKKFNKINFQNIFGVFCFYFQFFIFIFFCLPVVFKLFGARILSYFRNPYINTMKFIKKKFNKISIQYWHYMITFSEMGVLALLGTNCQFLHNKSRSIFGLKMLLLQKVTFWLSFETTVDIQKPH